MPTDLEHFVVVDGVGRDAGRGIGDQRQAEYVETHVPGDDDLVDGGHADEVCTENAEGADLGGCLEGRTEDGEVDAFRQVEA